LAAAQPVAEAPAQVEQAQSGITVYPPSFFAAQRPSTALDMVGRIPGFTYDSGDTARGFAGTASNVLIDGARPASKSDTTDNILSRIPAGDVERIELIRGGAPGVDMHGRTVLVNVVRKAASGSSLAVSVQDNLFADGHTIPGGSITYTGRFGPHQIDVDLSRYSSFDDSVGDGRVVTTYPNGVIDSQNARTAGHGGGVGLTTSYKGPLLGGTLNARFKLEETYFNDGLSFGLPPTEVYNDHNRARDGELGLNYERKFGPVGVELIGIQRLERDSGRSTGVIPGDNAFFGGNQSFGESIGRVVLRYAWSPSLEFETGGEAVYNFLDGDERYIDNGTPVPLPSSQVHVDEMRYETFGIATWKINPKLTLEAGARLEASTIEETGDTSKRRSFFYPKPRVLLTWSPLGETQVRLRVERKLGQLNFSNFVSTVDLSNTNVKGGNPDLRPDDHWQFEGAVEQRFWGKGSVVVTLLHEEVRDASDYVPIAGTSPLVDGPGNIGAGRSDQIDIETQVPLDRLGIAGGILKTTSIWRTSEVTDPLTHESRRISGQRPFVLQWSFDQDLPALKSTWGVAHFTGWRETYYRLNQIQRRHIGNQFVTLYWEYKPNPAWLLRVEGDNLIPFKFWQDQTLWNGPRDTATLDYEREITIQSQPRLFVKIKRTF
jgi:hypothetical protein